MFTKNKNKKAFTPLNSAMPTAQRRYLTGFTLIELLVVCAIIGVLATIVILNLMGAKSRSRYAKVVSDMTAISTAVKAYSSWNNNVYPDDVGTGVMPGALAEYLPGTWPTTPCGDAIARYDYENWGGCASVFSGGNLIGIEYDKYNGDRLYKYNIKGMEACTVGPAIVGADIGSVSEITCNE